MDVEPVIIPIEHFGIPRQQRLFLFLYYRIQCADVVGSIEIFVIDHERFEHRERIHRLFGRLLERLDRLFQVGDDIADAAAAPTRAGLVEHLVRSACKLVQHRRGRELVCAVRHGLGLDHAGEFVDKLVAGLFVLEMLTLIQAYEPNDALHIVRVRVAGGGLKHERRIWIDQSIHRGGEDRSGNHVDWNNVEDQLFIDRNDRLAAKRDQDEGRGRREPFVPAGERITLR